MKVGVKCTGGKLPPVSELRASVECWLATALGSQEHIGSFRLQIEDEHGLLEVGNEAVEIASFPRFNHQGVLIFVKTLSSDTYWTCSLSCSDHHILEQLHTAVRPRTAKMLFMLELDRRSISSEKDLRAKLPHEQKKREEQVRKLLTNLQRLENPKVWPALCAEILQNIEGGEDCFQEAIRQPIKNLLKITLNDEGLTWAMLYLVGVGLFEIDEKTPTSKDTLQYSCLFMNLVQIHKDRQQALERSCRIEKLEIEHKRLVSNFKKLNQERSRLGDTMSELSQRISQNIEEQQKVEKLLSAARAGWDPAE